MHTKTQGAPRAVFFSTASALPMLRGPMVTYSPVEEGGEDETPEEFIEQPGDREPDPDAEQGAEEGADDEDDAEEEGEAEGEEQAEDDAGGDAEEEAAEEGAEEEAEEPPAAETKKDWRDRQIAKLREKERTQADLLAEAQRRADAAEALLAAAPEERDAATVDAARETARKEALEQVRTEEYYKRINSGLVEMDAAGAKAFPKTWGARVDAVREVMSEELKGRPDFLEAIVDQPNSAAVYHELAGDPDKMEELLALPPHKMGVEIARLSDKLGKPAPKPISKLPAPIKPLTRGGTERAIEDLANDPNISQEEFNRRMDAVEDAKMKARG